MKSNADFPRLLQAFFTDRLMRQQQASPNTIAAHRDTFRLLVSFAQKRLRKKPSELSLEDLDAPFIAEFLNYLESERGNAARSRNVRLSGIRSFFHYVSFYEPSRGGFAQRVLSIPMKRYHRKQVEFLTDDEVMALLASPDTQTWIGRRDRVFLLVAVQTGLRVSEMIGLRFRDVVLGSGSHIRCVGKGRKERCTPLRKDTAKPLESWQREHEGQEEDPLFPNVKGGRLSRDAVERLVTKHADNARRRCPTLRRKHVTPHVLRHTAAMDLLQHGVDRTVIALWLGHESLNTVDVYLHADLRMKEEALAKTAATGAKPWRYRPDDEVLEFLRGL
jgi:site-specific recombinase XerD